jgi:hypothetical protein
MEPWWRLLPLSPVPEQDLNAPEDPIVFFVKDLIDFYFVWYGSSHTSYQIGAQLTSYNLRNTKNETHLYKLGIATFSSYVLR